MPLAQKEKRCSGDVMFKRSSNARKRLCFPNCVPQTLFPQDVDKDIGKVTSKESDEHMIHQISLL